ncbi:hypothetical protein QMT40_001858 [Parvibaculaceae bacterium PLY_AMNH_Bact1]|nr:hypothetical protein QMT40_001858 [Parvibaculaceae bacterium PLY_AMNH_Bact1]
MTTSIDGPKFPQVESAKTAHSLPFFEMAADMDLISRRLEHGENVPACQMALVLGSTVSLECVLPAQGV